DSPIRLRGPTDYHPARGSRRRAPARSPRDGPRRAPPALLGRLAPGQWPEAKFQRRQCSHGQRGEGWKSDRTNRPRVGVVGAPIRTGGSQEVAGTRLAECIGGGHGLRAPHDEFAHAQLPLTMLGPRKNLKLSLEQIETALRSAQKALRRFIRDLELG